MSTPSIIALIVAAAMLGILVIPALLFLVSRAVVAGYFAAKTFYEKQKKEIRHE